MKKVALLIGVEEYRDPGISRLQYARADAEALAERLRDRCKFDETKVLTGRAGQDAPDLLNIINALRDTAGELRDDDLFLLFFAGHGIEKDGHGYLLTHDSSYAFPEHVSLSLELLRKNLEKLTARYRILMLDACRRCPEAGKAVEDVRLGGVIARDIVAAARCQPAGGVTTALLSACRTGQKAYEWPAKGHGVFTHYLLEGLDGAAWDEEALEFKRLAAYAAKEVRRWAAQTPGLDTPQEPWYEEFGDPETIILAHGRGDQGADSAEREAVRRPDRVAAKSAARRKPPTDVSAGVLRYENALSPAGEQTVATPDEIPVLKGHDGRIWSVAFAPEGGRVVSAGTDRAVRLWDIVSKSQIRKFEGHTNTVNCIAVSPDGQRIASASVDRTIRVWMTGSDRKASMCLVGHTSNINSVAWSPDGRRLVSGSGGELKGRVWVAGNDDNVRLWDVEKKALVRFFKLHGRYVWSVAYSPDGRLAASGGWDKVVIVWDVATGREMISFPGHTDEIRCVAFSPDGSLIASSSADGTIMVWNIPRKKALGWGMARMRHGLKGHAGAVLSVAFSPDGKKVLSGGEDKTVRLWNLDTGNEVHCFKGHTGAVLSVVFSPDGRLAASAGDDAAVRIWRVPGFEDTSAHELARQGEALFDGKGQAKDFRKAAQVLWQASLAGEANAQNLLGWMYLNAHGVPRDFRQAALLFAESARQGCAEGQCNLAWRYVNGQGVRKDEAQARKWFEKAAAQGHEGAARDLERTLGTRVDVRKNKGTEPDASAPGGARHVTGEAGRVALGKIKALSRDFFTRDQPGRRAAAEAVAEIAPVVDLASILLLCRSADRGERVAGFVAIATYLRIEPPDRERASIVEILRLGLSDEESRVRYRALQSLERTTAIARALEPELDILADTDPSEPVREVAVRLRGRLRSK